MIDSYNTILLNKILSKFSSGNKLEAFKELTKFLENNPNDMIATYNHGYMCQQLNKFDLDNDIGQVEKHLNSKQIKRTFFKSSNKN